MVRVGMARIGLCNGVSGNCLRRTHYQPAMLHALCTDQAVSQLLDIPRLAAKYNHLQTVLMIKMRMQGGNDNRVRLMLEIGKLFRQQTGVMVVNESDSANDRGIAGNNDGADEPVTNQIAKGFGAVLVAMVCYERIKAI